MLEEMQSKKSRASAAKGVGRTGASEPREYHQPFSVGSFAGLRVA